MRFAFDPRDDRGKRIIGRSGTQYAADELPHQPPLLRILQHLGGFRLDLDLDGDVIRSCHSFPVRLDPAQSSYMARTGVVMLDLAVELEGVEFHVAPHAPRIDTCIC